MENETQQDLPDSEMVGQAKSFLEGVLERMDFGGTVEVHEEDERWILEVQSETPDRVIGRRGQVIDALQHLTVKVVGKKLEKPIILDAGGYREKHIERLTGIAEKSRERVLEHGKPVRLSPMSAYDRRIIHMKAAELGDVRTESDGEGEDRHVVMYPTES